MNFIPARRQHNQKVLRKYKATPAMADVLVVLVEEKRGRAKETTKFDLAAYGRDATQSLLVKRGLMKPVGKLERSSHSVPTGPFGRGGFRHQEEYSQLATITKKGWEMLAELGATGKQDTKGDTTMTTTNKKKLTRRIRKLETRAAMFEPGKPSPQELASAIAGFVYVGSKAGTAAANIKKKAQTLKSLTEEILNDPDKSETVTLAAYAGHRIVTLLGFMQWALDMIDKYPGEKLANNANDLKLMKRRSKKQESNFPASK